MVVNMLKAISEMLLVESFGQSTKSAEDARRDADSKLNPLEIRVRCAKTMLDEIIKALEGKPIGDIITRVSDKMVEEAFSIPPTEKPAPPKPPAPPKRDPEYLVTLNTDKTLKLIRGLPMTGKLLVDKKEMTHEQAIGKPFKKVEILS